MITLIIMFFFSFLAATLLFDRGNKIARTKNIQEPIFVFSYFLHVILMIFMLVFGLWATKESDRANNKCPEFTPVKEQLYKIK